MNAIEYLKNHHANDTIISKGITLAKFCTLETTYKNTSIIPCNLLNIVYKGTKVLHTKDGDVEIKAGEAFLITKGEYVMSEVVGDEEYMCLLIFFEQQLTKQLISELPFKFNSNKIHNTQNLLKFKVDSFLQNSVDSLKLYLDNKPTFTDELLTLKLKELMLLLLGSKARQNIIRFFQTSILDKSDLKSFMENNYEKDLTIAEYAKLSGRSLSAFKNEFKAIYKETPMKWILKKRLEKGKFLIQELGYEVGLAAHTVGFKTHAHFTRLYTKEFGNNPSFIDK
ncbi:AraC family transcriptional regulator [Sulfurospirillum arcachonense]|uniref:AraC family transcriptional regulator n=1 Tax=Sulfurospirillum arcachonense TaxID=57666 RepID=UPI00046A7A33|nr:AraC family transcriptional regulator [Sulfurospirillum arcachonense]